MRCAAVAAALLAAAFSAGTVAAQTNAIRLEVMSRTPSGPSQLMTGEGTSTQIVGWLSVPPRPAARMPAMVISHGSGGILDGREHAWAARLNALGVATLVVDSFTPRGIEFFISPSTPIHHCSRLVSCPPAPLSYGFSASCRRPFVSDCR